ncbi:MAG: hypothetical protein GWO20_19960 [Candidatus Korarchaeota archaeon]|nr:hypothetical protein [Candidatus Korarchaeota archaeon]NIU85508.1 hypothetical protein [Candidatus Thorarchaeota archaeon]NIW15625.1 hypothetical protein [Candidatus Thorarchaeota archaeon]NIW53556.1 hypothetical protein [Candidatus Korarchaeota archaeon]
MKKKGRNTNILLTILVITVLFVTFVPYNGLNRGTCRDKCQLRGIDDEILTHNTYLIQGGKAIHTRGTNLTFMNVTVNVSLRNGETFSYSSPHAAVSNITEAITGNGSILDINNVTSIRNTSLFLYHDILQALGESEETNKTSTILKNESVRGTKLFFSTIHESHPNYTEIFNGTIVPVTEGEFFHETYGKPFEKTFLYGSLPLVNVTGDLSFSKGHNLLVYLNTTSKNTSRAILHEAMEVSNDCQIIPIDLANNASAATRLEEEFNVTIALDQQTGVSGFSETNTSSFFGLEGRTPALIFTYIGSDESSGLVWRKTLGIESAEDIRSYLRAFSKGLSKTGIGSNTYPILGITAENLKPDKRADIFVGIGTGFGEVSDYGMNVTFFNEAGAVIGEENETYSLTKKGNVLKGTVNVPEEGQNPKRLEVYIKVSSNGVELVKRASFEIEIEEEDEEEPWGVYLGIGVAIAILIIGMLLNRKYGKKGR